jgi:hypothetical protein
MTKKAVTTALTLLVLLTAITGCGGNGKTSTHKRLLPTTTRQTRLLNTY